MSLTKTMITSTVITKNHLWLLQTLIKAMSKCLALNNTSYTVEQKIVQKQRQYPRGTVLMSDKLF